MKTFTTKQNNRRKLRAAHDHSVCAPCAGCGRTLPRRHYGVTFCATCEKRLAGKPVTGPMLAVSQQVQAESERCK